MIRYFQLLSLFVLFICSPVVAETNLGGNYTCVGDAVFRGDKELSDQAANRQANNKVKNLNRKLKDAKDRGANQRELKKLAKQIKDAKALRKQIAACAKGDLSGGLSPIWTRLTGSYPNGSYNDTVNGASGPITATMTLNGTVFSGIITVGGDLYGPVFGKPIKFNGDVNGVSFPFSFKADESAVGDLSFVVSADGKLEIIANNVPHTLVKELYFTANLGADNNISGTYDIGGIFGLKFGGGTFSMIR